MSEDSRPALKFKSLLFLALIAAVLAFVPFPSLRGVVSETNRDEAILTANCSTNFEIATLACGLARNDGVVRADSGHVAIDIDT